MEDINTTVDFEQEMLGFSLIWENNERKKDFFEMDGEACHDLNLDKLINFISRDAKRQGFIKTVFSRLSTDPGLVNFRLSILEDFVNNPELIGCFQSLLPNLEVMSGYNDFLLNNDDEKILLHDVAWRLYVLDNYITCVIALNKVFSEIKNNIRSDGLKTFFRYIEYVMKTGSFVSCKNELPELIDKISNIKSVTIGINLDFKMSPVEATLISVNDKKIERHNIFTRLFSGDIMKKKSNLYSLYSKGISGNIDHMHPGTIKNLNLKLNRFFSELSGLLYGVIKPIEDQLKKYTGIKTRLLARLKHEFLYYIDIVNFLNRIMATGLPMCKPEVVPMEERCQSVKENYNMNLAIHLIENEKKDVNETIIKNDVNIDDNGRIMIITGPNQGGKTTYLNAVGLTQLLAQSGIFIPGTEAKICIIDNILTHFPIEEKPDKLEGRLGEEAKRLKIIFEKITKYSLVLLNESLTSTSPVESTFLAKDIMKIFRITGSIVLYATHLHELAMEIDDINSSVKGDSRLISMVSMVKEVENKYGSDDKIFKRSYKIIPGKPMGKSYAHEIAVKHGIDYDQLREKLIKRGIIKSD